MHSINCESGERVVTAAAALVELSGVFQISSAAGGSKSLRAGRLLLALGVTPFLPGFYGALLFGQPWALPIGVVVAYPSALLFGVPLLAIMRKKNYLRWWDFIIAGTLCAVPALIAYGWRVDVPHVQSFNSLSALFVLAWGAFSGACFWLIGIAGDAPLRFRDIFDVGPPGPPRP